MALPLKKKMIIKFCRFPKNKKKFQKAAENTHKYWGAQKILRKQKKVQNI